MPDKILEINAGGTYTVNSTVTEQWTGADIDGALDVDGTLILTQDPDTAQVADSGAIDLPMTLPNNLSMVSMGTAMFLGFVLTLVGAAAAWLRNYAAGIMWAFAFIALIFSGLFSIGLEVFWVLILGTIMLLIAGGMARWLS